MTTTATRETAAVWPEALGRGAAPAASSASRLPSVLLATRLAVWLVARLSLGSDGASGWRAAAAGEGGGEGGEGGGDGGGDGGGGAAQRSPQSSQSVPTLQAAYSEPGPPSSQSPSAGYDVQLLAQHGGGGEGGAAGGGGRTHRGPQSSQSCPSTQKAYAEPGPPSSQAPSPARYSHALLHRSVPLPHGGSGGGADGGHGGSEPLGAAHVNL